jgi:hypothetical protein
VGTAGNRQVIVHKLAHMSRSLAHCSTRLHRTEAATSRLTAVAHALNSPAMAITEHLVCTASDVLKRNRVRNTPGEQGGQQWTT